MDLDDLIDEQNEYRETLIFSPPAPPSTCAKPGYGHGTCCCNCKWRAIDYSHPHTDGQRVIHARGYACLAPEFEETRDGHNTKVVFSGWPEHGLCEMHDFARPALVLPGRSRKVENVTDERIS